MTLVRVVYLCLGEGKNEEKGKTDKRRLALEIWKREKAQKGRNGKKEKTGGGGRDN